MLSDRPAPDLAPVPTDVTYLGTLMDRVYYAYGGVIWVWTTRTWYGVCLFTDWPRRPEAHALAAQRYLSDMVPLLDECLV